MAGRFRSTTLNIVVGQSDGGFEVVDLLLVTSLKQRGNGSKRRGRGKQRPE
jgi:hypothetical protein